MAKTRLVKTVYNVTNERSAALVPQGMRVALLADFHNTDPEGILKILREDVPDMIMIPGDVVLGFYPEGNDLVIDRCHNLLPFLRGCAETAPTFMSVGNHECLLCDEEFEIIRSCGVKVLDNEWIEFSPDSSAGSGSSRILIGGLTSAMTMGYHDFREDYNRGRSEEEQLRYPYRKRPRDIGKYPAESGWLADFTREEGYKILLCHHPEYWSLREPMIRDMDIDLVLAGHAHGGQWRVFGRGIFAPGQGLLPKYTNGVHHGPHGRLVISRGLSNPYGAVPRWGNPCEVVYLIL